jgi:membrane protein implicated in regulation of membrane protease activity
VSPRARGEIVHPRLLSGGRGRPLNFTVRSQLGQCQVTVLRDIGLGLLIAALLYQALQFISLVRSSRSTPRRSITGVEALVGSDAEVVEDFMLRGAERSAIGRVRVGNESWQAQLLDGSGRLATVGDHLSVVGVSGALLKVTWR